ncbi:putative cell wall organization and biogenesis-related protein [Naematelia encephala]|uniref:Inactive metallocarboxypeptidase ECM14 n=1 Tax=Naematelia encephala TaxID=71784 RepID=A0A1Y2BJA5_9TREE|nr:putative cell wall organization and biogenesis-related protein [Naematelia encephala]
MGRLISLGAIAVLCAPIVSALAVPDQTVWDIPSKSQRDRYDGHEVWRVDWEFLGRDAQEKLLEHLHLRDVDIWRSTPSALDIRVPPHTSREIRLLFPPRTLIDTLIPDLQTHIESSAVMSRPKRSDWDASTLRTPFYDAYHDYDDINRFGAAMVRTFNGVKGITVEEFSIGKTAEGREIKGWTAHLDKEEPEGWRKHSGKERGKGRKRPVEDEEDDEGDDDAVYEFVIQSGQHAREWVGPASAIYAIHSLLLEAANNPDSEAAKYLHAFAFTVVPLLNPDGYEYSQKHSRMWRKNRQDTGHKGCEGIDLNSNWGYKWGPRKTISACSESYPGAQAFEAYETKAMANYLANGTTGRHGQRKVRAFIDLHSYGQLFMFPFAHSCADFPPDAEMLMEAGLGVAKTMRLQRGEEYQSGQACDMTYRAPGDSIDYAYGVIDARWSYSAELRDTGTYGFMLPADQIRPNAEEVAAGLTYLAKFIYNAEIVN